MYLNMLQKIEWQVLTPILMNDFAKAYESQNHDKMLIAATNLREMCLKLGASHLYYYCKQI